VVEDEVVDRVVGETRLRMRLWRAAQAVAMTWGCAGSRDVVRGPRSEAMAGQWGAGRRALANQRPWSRPAYEAGDVIILSWRCRQVRLR
jgi:hypothetical protein